MTYVIAQPCVDLKDRACVDECPVDCIYEGKRMLYIHPDECVDCGACEPVCPVEAIFYEDDTPEQWKDYYDANVALLRRPRLARWRRQDGRDRQGPPADRRAAAAGARRVTTRPRLRAGSRTSPGTGSPTYAERARAHPDGIVDLSIGTPVDPTPEVVQDALRAAADSPGYPLTIGRADDPAGLRRLAGAPARRHRARPRRRAAGDRLQGAGRLAARPARLGAGRPGRLPGARLPDVRGRRGARRRPRAWPPTR